ncbi:MAG: TauD/TfdA family dioxygenase [Actinomycetota bacterium]
MHVAELNGADPMSAPIPDVLAGLAEHGVVRFRGVDTSASAFAEVTHRFSSRFTCDPFKVGPAGLVTAPGRLGQVARVASRAGAFAASKLGIEADDDGTRTAPREGYGLNPHNENTFIPAACPEMVWFACDTPASDGGSTLLCDGRDLWAALTPEAQALATSEPVRYELTFSRRQWQAVYDTTSAEAVMERLHTVKGTTAQMDDAGTLRYVFDVDQVGRDHFADAPVLSTNVLSRRPLGQVGDAEVERLASGDPLPSWFVGELLAAVDEHHLAVDLQAGDMILIDNTRVMHGRAAFTDLSRKVLTRCAWFDPEKLAA